MMLMPAYHPIAKLRHAQSGAALVVGLILLVALTLLALASMNSASLDLIMVGNEQYRAQTFAAAEAGIEQADANAANFDTGTTTNGSGVTATGESYSWTVGPFNGGAVYAATDGNSVGTYQSIFFTITSTGTGPRNSTAKHVQEEKISVKTGDNGPSTNNDLVTTNGSNIETMAVTP